MRQSLKKNLLKIILSILVILGELSIIIVNTHLQLPSKYMASAISGILTSICITLEIFLILVSSGQLFAFVLSTNIIRLLQVTIAILYFKQYNSIPGLVIDISSLIALIIFYKYAVRIEKQRLTIKKYSEVDGLTGLLNRYGFINVVDTYIKEQTPFYLISIDLDNFKTINDIFGHDIGDEFIVNSAVSWSNLKSYVNYTLARLGGDEFGILLPCKTEETLIKFLNEITTTLETSNWSKLTCSIGIANFPSDSDSIKSLMSYADTAMHKAKSTGKNKWCLFNTSLQKEIETEYLTKKYIQDALLNKSFEIVYQPQYKAKTEQLYGFESLLRLRHDDTYIPTQYLINIAEKSQIIFDIDIYVLDTVTRLWSPIIQQNPDLIISINISGKHFNISNFYDDLYKIITKNNFNPHNLCIEITESAFINSISLAESLVQKLKTLGILIAIDDFGTGYSSINYLSSFKADHIKIEKSFTDTIEQNPTDHNIVNITAKIGHLIGASVIIEGVETKKQVQYANHNACDIIQGYYYSKPVSFSIATKMLI